MKKLFKLSLFSLAVLATTAVNAQDYDHDYNNNHRDHYTKKSQKSSMFSKKDFGLILGLNAFDKAYDMPELQQWQSRYVALQWRKNHKLITGNQVDVALGTGLEVAWNNYMMKYDEQYYEDGPISDFELVETDLQKSKLVVNNLNLPVMLQFGFKESNFHFGVGVYGGMKINSYQKFQEYDGAKYKEKGDYNLRKFNYGLMAEAGKGDFRLFAKYDMLPIFNDNNPINANTFTVGIRF